jgi:hypothetical protein
MFNLKNRKEMKKFFMTLAAVAMAATMNAQGYIGGSVGFQSVSYDGNSTSAFTIMPEIGYNLDENLSVGVVVGYGESGKDENKVKKFAVNPYLRYTFAKFDKVNLFVDGGIGYLNTKYNAYKNNTFEIGVKPGVAVNLNDKLSFVSHFGFLGWATSKDDTDGAKALNTVGLSVDATSLSFGLYYNF